MAALPPGARVAVVGAGIIGTSAAFMLAERGYAVTLFDRAEPGATGPSRGNAGHVVGSGIFPLAEPGIGVTGLKMLADPDGPLKVPPAHAASVAPWLWKFWRSSYGAPYERAIETLVDLNRGVVEETETLFARAGIARMVRRAPALYLYESEASFRASAGHWARRVSAGLASTPVDAAAIRDLEPALAPIFVRGMISHDWAIVSDPFEVVGGLFAAARARGIAWRQVMVDAIEGANVVAGGDREPFDAVLVAAGVWSKPLARSLGETLPVEAERGYNLTYPDHTMAINRPLVLADRGVVATALTPGLRLGGWTELGGTTLPPNPAHWQAMRRITDAVLPGLRGAPAVEWMGHRPSMPDSIPVISRSARHPSVFYALGHGHYGLSWAAKTARMIGELVAGEVEDAALAPFSISRFR